MRSALASTSAAALLLALAGCGKPVGIPHLTTRFDVSKAPFQQDGRWLMVVDGIELTRAR